MHGRCNTATTAERFVLSMGISNNCLFRRILWTARTLHEASEAISLVSNPLFSKLSIKICCAASSCGAIVVADTKAGWQRGRKKRLPPILPLSGTPAYLPGTSHTSHRPTRPTILKKLTKNLATRNSPFTVYIKLISLSKSLHAPYTSENSMLCILDAPRDTEVVVFQGWWVLLSTKRDCSLNYRLWCLKPLSFIQPQPEFQK